MVGRIQNVGMRAVVLLQPDQLRAGIVALEGGHVAHVGATEGVDGLVVVAHSEQRGPTAGQQRQPAVLQVVGVLELVDEDVPEALLVVLAQRLVALQQLIGTQQQLGKVHHALALALLVVGAVQLGQPAAVGVMAGHVGGAQAGLLAAVDEVLDRLGLELLVIDVEPAQQPLDGAQLVGAVHDLEAGRQAGVTMVCAQQPVAQPVEGSHPHGARIGPHQHGSQARHHLARGLVGEGHGHDFGRRALPGPDQPRDAGGEHAGLAAAGPRQNQCMSAGDGDSSPLLWIEMGK